VLFEELKSFEIMEKRRYQTNMELEKNLIQVRGELNEIKMHNKALETNNIDLKGVVKTVAQERKFLDQENIKLKYTYLKEREKDQENISDNINSYHQRNASYQFDKSKSDKEPVYNPFEADNLQYTFKKSRMDKNNPVFSSIENYQGFKKDVYDIKEMPEGSTTDRGISARPEAEKVNLRFASNTKSGSQMKLKDRLDQAKYIVSSMRKSEYDEVSKDR